MASTPGPIPTAKPKQRKTTIKEIADIGNRGLPPESELKVYEFSGGRKGKKAGRGPYADE